MKRLACFMVFILVLSVCLPACRSDDDKGKDPLTTTTFLPPSESTADTTANIDVDTTAETTAETTANIDVDTTAETTVETEIKWKDETNLYVYVTGDSVWLRTEPKLEVKYRFAKGVKYGDKLLCKASSPEWLKVEFEGKVLYISADCVTEDDLGETDFEEEPAGTVVYVKADVLTLRRGPSADTDSLRYLKKGASCERISKNATWSKVKYTFKDEHEKMQTLTGFVNSKYVTTEKPA